MIKTKLCVFLTRIGIMRTNKNNSVPFVEHLFQFVSFIYNYLSFGSYKMELNRELSQQSWLEVKLCELDDSYGCCLPIGKSPFITSWML